MIIIVRVGNKCDRVYSGMYVIDFEFGLEFVL